MSRFLENDSSIIPGSVPLQDSKYGSIKNNFASLSSLQVEPRSRAISILKCESSPRRAFTEPKTEINSPARNSSRRIMSTSRVRQSEYNYMTDPKNFRPILLQIGIERNSIRNNLLGTDFRIIVVQSVVRRHLVNRNFQLRYLHRENYRKTLNSELYIRQGDKPDFVPLRFLVKLYNKDLRNELAYLIESISAKKCDNEYNILFFLFRCMLPKRRDTLTAYEVSSFILNVLCYEFNEIGIINKFVSHPYFNRITFQDFYEWFKKNKSYHRLKVSNYKIFKMKKLDSNFPPYFFNNYIELRSVLYDVVLQLHMYDKINPADFQCPYCSYNDFIVLNVARHIIDIHKRKKSELIK